MGDTNIEWTDKTWNPIRGCTRVSEGCRNCYAEAVARRFSGPGLAYEGLVRIDAAGKPHGWNGQIKFVEEHLLDPLKWKGKPLYDAITGKRVGYAPGLRIFVNSMSDLFHEKVTDEWIDKIFAVMALCPQHTFQILTKRPERMLSYFNEIDEEKDKQRWINAAYESVPHLSPCAAGMMEDQDYPLPNVHLGVSCENQPTADKRIPLLLQTPAAVRFISAEPLLGAINLDGDGPEDLHALGCGGGSSCGCGTTALDWVIVGGESGPGARACHLGWIRPIVDQCQAASVPIFAKQLGSNPIIGTVGHLDIPYTLRDKKGGDMDEWPADLRIREFPKDFFPANVTAAVREEQRL